MKRFLLQSLTLGIVIFTGTALSTFSQVSLPHYDGMEYTAGSFLQTQGGWTANNTGDDLIITEGSLSFPDYIASRGNKVTFAGSGIDAYKSIETISAGTVYYSFIFKVTDVSAATNSDGGYFTGFGQNTTLFGATVWLRKNGDNFDIGINSRTTTTVTAYSTTSFSINTDILIVVSYQINSESGDDVASIWINPPSSSFGSLTVPDATLSVTNTGATDLSSISSVFIRQDSNTETPAIEMDELRISETWQNVVPLTAAEDLTAPVFSAGYPEVENIDATQADLAVSMDEAGTAYYVVVPDGATAPTVEEVVAGTDYGTVVLTAHGTIDILAGGTAYSATLTGLTDKTDYDIYVVAEDDEDTPNRQTATALVDLYTIRPPDMIFSEDFETAGSLSPFTQVSITGDQIWIQTEYSNNGYAYMNGYVSGSGAYENEDWLISPLINLAASEMNLLSFMNAKNFQGPDIAVKISEDFSGNYNATDIEAATWTDITSQFSYSGGSYTWVASGDFSLDAYAEGVYVAFIYTSLAESNGAAGWEIDDFTITGYLLPGSDATLSDLLVDGTTIASFDSGTLTYDYILEASVTTPPAVTYVTSDDGATAVVTPATDLSGDAPARTSTVEVTAANGNTKLTYSILFNPIIAVNDMAALRAVASADRDRIYQVTGEVLVTGLNPTQRNQKYVQDATAGILIDDASGVITTVYSEGDGITGLTGTLTEYSNLLEFVPYRDPGTASSTGKVLIPQVVTVADFIANQENYESELVTLEGVTFAAADGSATFAEKTNYNISAGTDVTILRTIFLGTDLTGKVIPYMADVTGIATVYGTDAQLAPRSYGDFNIYSSEATLSDLRVSGTTVTGFASGTLIYNVSLDAGTTAVPTVTATPTEANAAVVVTPATSLSGNEAERTTKVDVTSHDQSAESHYTVVFTVATGIEDNPEGHYMIYPVPASNEITISGTGDVSLIEIFDITGNILISETCADEDIKKLNVDRLAHGVYFIRLTTARSAVITRFIKK